MRCPACGKTIEEDISFCAYCGAPITAPPEGRVPSRRIIVAAVAALALVVIVSGAAAIAFLAASQTPTPTRVAFATRPATALASPTLEPSPTSNISIAEPSPTELPFATPVPATPVPTRPAPSSTPVPATPIVMVVTATFTPSPTPPPTATPSMTPTRSFFPLRLTSPQNKEVFKEEMIAPFLEWRAATDGSLMPDEWYRIQVYHTIDQLQCNLYTKQTFFQLPASAMAPCDPNTWRFNTGDYMWRISFVIKVDNDVHHDIELINSEGRLFKWNK